MFLVDTHCHLNLDSFQNDIDQVVERALEAGVTKIVVPGLDLPTSLKAVEIASRFECVYAAIGIHPNESHQFDDDQITIFEKLLSEKKVVAVGEIGLDYYHNPDTKSRQIKVLKTMLNLASDHNKPVILHSRKSLDALLEMIQNWIVGSTNKNFQTATFRGVFHAFEGTPEQALISQKLNFAIGVGGPVTYKNAVDKQQVVTTLGISNVVLETDAPFLSPQPFRGTRNEPSRIQVIAQKVSDLINMPLDEVTQITTKNANSLFNWNAKN